MPVFVCHHVKNHTVWLVEPPGDEFAAGCSKSALVPLPDRSLDAKEFVVRKVGDRHEIRALASPPRLYVNDEVIPVGRDGTGARRLEPGDRIRVGDLLIQYVERRPAREEDWGELEAIFSSLAHEPLPETGAEPTSAVAVSPRRRGARRIAGSLFGALVLGAALGIGLALATLSNAPPPSDANATTVSIPPAQEPPPPSVQGSERLKNLAATLAQNTEPVPKLQPPENARRGTPKTSTTVSEPAGPGSDARAPPSSNVTAPPPPPPTPRAETNTAAAVHLKFKEATGRPPTREEVMKLAGQTESALTAQIAAIPVSGLSARPTPATSLLVHLANRTPRDAAEAGKVAAALERPGGVWMTAYMLAFAPENTLGRAARPVNWIEWEVARFLGRKLTTDESSQLRVALGKLDSAVARQVLPFALATLDAPSRDKATRPPVKVVLVVRHGELVPDEVSPRSRGEAPALWDLALAGTTAVYVRGPARSLKSGLAVMDSLFPEGDGAPKTVAELVPVDPGDQQSAVQLLYLEAECGDLIRALGAPRPLTSEKAEAVRAIRKVFKAPDVALPFLAPPRDMVRGGELLLMLESTTGGSAAARDARLRTLAKAAGPDRHVLVLNVPEGGHASLVARSPALRAGRVFTEDIGWSTVGHLVMHFLGQLPRDRLTAATPGELNGWFR